MAIVFELVINYGQDHAAAEIARQVVAAHSPLAAGSHRIRLHQPLTSTMRDAAGEPCRRPGGNLGAGACGR